MIYIFADLDGTLIDSRAGQHLIDKKDFDEFSNRTDEYPAFEDDCNLIRVACASSGQKKILVIFTAREEKWRDKTVAWLDQHNIPYDHLMMRKTGDARTDVAVKEENFIMNFGNKNVWFVLEDRDDCVSMWRQYKLTCLQMGVSNSQEKQWKNLKS